MELTYETLSKEIQKKLKRTRGVILATSADNTVAARQVSAVNDGLTIMFSTSIKSNKAKQIKQNPNVAVAFDNVKIEAVAEAYGHPSGHSAFMTVFKKKFPIFAKVYKSLPDDVLIIIKPKKIALYKFIGGACEDILDVENCKAYRSRL